MIRYVRVMSSVAVGIANVNRTHLALGNLTVLDDIRVQCSDDEMATRAMFYNTS